MSVRQELTDEAVDALLAEVAGAADELITESAAADRALDDWVDQSERFLERRASAPAARLDAREAVVSVRRELAKRSAGELRRAAREWVAWWADAATYAVAAASVGEPVSRSRLMAVAPCDWWASEGATYLPEPPEYIVELVELTARMATASVAGGQPMARDMLVNARDLAARQGLWLRQSDDGEWRAVEDITVEGHRRRLWGNSWADYQLPLVPEVRQLATALIDHGVPPAVVREVHDAAAEVEELLVAAARLSALPSLAEQFQGHELDLGDDEIDALHDRLLPATDVIAAYAATLTRHLPAIRAAART